MTTNQTNETQHPDQAKEFYARLQARTLHPSGSWDKAGRFFCATRTTLPCCQAVRNPSRAYPYSEMVHARTLKHVKNALAAGLTPGQDA